MFLKIIKPWIVSFRLRTLPLSASCIVMGSFLAAWTGKFDTVVFILALVTTILLQILSNISNEYGDMVKGTDSESRVGPERSIQKGDITLHQMKRMIIVIVIITAVSGVSLVLYATRSYYTIIFIVAGGSAIVAAIKYTVGRNPYGYMALGDPFVFIFFGPVGVLGTFFLHTGLLRYDIFLPSITAGLLSVAVLNLNNMRDTVNDLEYGKITLASVMGIKYSRIYHAVILLAAVVSSVTFAFMNSLPLIRFFYTIAFIPLVIDLRKVFTYKNHAELDSELKIVAISNFLHSLFLGAALLV
ncbi:MAG TPA: 1,4-dihydroxy-2-naphthoate octaprenyltransferase [Spirochaetota bacterium]|nr:1,4-dihydroxy-2-naphthoate octaprenyltransferase [Spirochaetota bacterium]